MIMTMAMMIQMAMVGGKFMPMNFPFMAARFDSHFGTVPNTFPANCEPIEVMIWVKPASAKPDPSVTISACPCKR